MEIAALGQEPISEQAPAGSDVRFEPDFEALSREVEKLASPTAGGAVDWQRVADLSQKILETTSKDLLVACYFCIALMQTQGIRGLATGVQVLHELLEHFWDTLYPAKKRMKGRINALTWWKERINAYLPSVKPETWPKTARDALLSDFSAIDDFLGKNIDDAPMLNAMISRLTELIVEAQAAPDPSPAPPPAPAATPETPAVAAAQQPSPPAAAPPEAPRVPAQRKRSVSTDTAPRTLVENGLDLLDQAAALLMVADPFDPAVYRLNRIVAWSTVDSPPPAEESKTLLPPPDTMVLAALSRLYQAGSWRDLLDAAEGRIREFLFWLDLNRYTAEALSQLGQSAVADQVAQETWHYTRRLPGIETLRFSDGTAFADPQTRDWLKAQGGSNAPAPGGSGQDAAASTIDTALAEAEDLVQKNKLGEALGGLRHRMGQARSLRERFLWQMGICRLMVKANKTALARPYIDDCLSLIDQYQLEKWEPALAADALAAVIRGLRDGGEEPGSDLMVRITARLSYLDPVKALEIMV
ncbi:MAG: type VI secretion system protein TssA [Pseudomonadota bacterium]